MPSNLQGDATPFIKRQFQAILKPERRQIVLDAPCGMGRNALYIQSFGCSVVAVDRDRISLNKAVAASRKLEQGFLIPVVLDFDKDNWPFPPDSFDIAINVHLVSEPLWKDMIASLRPGGFLLLETYENRGQNYLELPKKGRLLALLEDFEVIVYEEKPAGPTNEARVTVKLLARKSGQ